jgi:ATP-dependent Clp protease ATP-binding subunit ClpA
MFERFTDRARTVVVMAQEEARGLGHNFIGTEHLLLGILAEGNGAAATVLEGAGISLDVARADVERIIGRGVDIPAANIPFTPRAKKVLEHSLRESLRLGNNYIDIEHILLGVLSEGEGVAAQILVSHGLALDDTRVAVIQAIGVPVSALAVGRWTAGTAPPRPRPRQQNTTPAVAEIYARARGLARDRPVSSAHMLRALVAGTDSQAARALTSLDVNAERIEEALAATSPVGTTDETPEDAIGRIATIRTEEGSVVIELSDRDLAALLKGGTGELTGRVARALDELRASLEHEARRKQQSGATMDE